MDIPMNQIHFGLCSMKKSMQNYKRLAISIHKMVPAKFASQHCIRTPLRLRYMGDFMIIRSQLGFIKSSLGL